jgi:NAD(P)-dependent dehydrogenase (short-subunit alcohol dehydrogenase family)
MTARQDTGDLSGRHVVVTGATGGLGPAVVAALTGAGAICQLPPRHEVDLTDEAAVARYYAGLPAPPWASVHVAGGFVAAPITATSLSEFRRQIDINLVTCFLCCREAVRRMAPAGGGRIINVGSRAALAPAGGAIAYSAAKAGVVSLTQCLADEVKATGILVNAVIPSIIDTPANRAAMPQADHARWPRPEAIAAAVVWLAGPDNQLVSGGLLPVYGQA